MQIHEQVPFASCTTFKLGGPARWVCECETEEDITRALAFARERSLAWYVVGGGSNLLVNDEGYDGVVLQMKSKDMRFEEQRSAEEGSIPASVIAIADAGVNWDTFVEEAVVRGLWGIENLAGIPGTVGAAPVQNIGAYGTETRDTLVYVDVLDTSDDTIKRITNSECAFGYRESRFKHDPSLVILRAAFALSHEGMPRTSYADLITKAQEGVLLDTPQAIANAVREIRSRKFPDLAVTGTAGSFFKNPIILKDAYDALLLKYPELPGFVGEEGVKVSIAWILDHVLSLRGYKQGFVRLFENQPLVIVAEKGATMQDVDALASYVERKVFEATGITLEREVRML